MFEWTTKNSPLEQDGQHLGELCRTGCGHITRVFGSGQRTYVEIEVEIDLYTVEL